MPELSSQTQQASLRLSLREHLKVAAGPPEDDDMFTVHWLSEAGIHVARPDNYGHLYFNRLLTDEEMNKVMEYVQKREGES